MSRAVFVTHIAHHICIWDNFIRGKHATGLKHVYVENPFLIRSSQQIKDVIRRSHFYFAHS